MTIIGPMPKRWPRFLYGDEYFIRLEPVDLPSGIEIRFLHSRGIEGNLDGLNPALFSRQ